RRVADYRALFARAAVMTPEAVRTEIEAIKQSAAGRQAVTDLPSLASELERVRKARLQDWADFMEKMEKRPPYDWEAHQRHRRRDVASTVAGIVQRSGSHIAEGSAALDDIADKVIEAESWPPVGSRRTILAPESETITQAAEAWFGEMQRPGAGVRSQTLDGH